MQQAGDWNIEDAPPPAAFFRGKQIVSKEYYVLIRTHGVYVKEGEFFKSQDGLKEEWGKNWERITADSLYNARSTAITMRRERFPDSHRTIGEDERMEDVWPEAKGI